MTRIALRRRALRGVMLLLTGSVALGAPAGAQTPPSSPVVARVQGRPITQADFDRIAQAYFAQLRGQYGGTLPDDVAKIANQNVLNELIRRELLVAEFERRRITVGEAETDAILRQDPFFRTQGKFDETKFRQFKVSPGSNYLQVLPSIRELAGATKLDSIVRAELRPSAPQVRAEWIKRNDQARFDVLALNRRDMNAEPEASLDEQLAFYEAHPDRFVRKSKVRLRYVKLLLPAAGDPARGPAQSDSLARARGMADALSAGASIDSLAGVGPPLDTGLFDVPAIAVPGLGRPEALLAAVAPADSDSVLRVIGPLVLPDAVLVGTLAERKPRATAPFPEARAEAKRLADQEKRRTTLDQEKRAHYTAHPEAFRAPLAKLTRITLAESKLSARWPSVQDIERWYQKRGAEMFPAPIATLPPLSDSLRGVARERLVSERRAEQARRVMERIAAEWRRGRDPRQLVRGTEAALETLSLYSGMPSDSIFPIDLCDSLVRQPGAARVGEVQGPRRLFGHSVAWRVDSQDTAYAQPYEQVEKRVEQVVLDERRAHEEVEAEAYFEAHRDRYKTQDKYALEVIAIAIPPPDSVVIREDELRHEYQSRLGQYRSEAQVRARHILLLAPNPETEGRARKRADSLRVAILAGADFAELARTFSEDPGSASQGGDLGFFGRGRMVKAFEDTSFALEPGVVSQPVKTPFGYHLIKVESKQPERLRPFEEVRPELQRTIAQTRGDTLARRAAARVRRDLARGVDPAVAAADVGGVRTLEPVAAGQALDSFGLVVGLAEDLSPKAVGQWLRKEYRTPNAYLVVKPVRHVPPGPADFTEAKPQALEDQREAKRTEIMDRKVAAIRERLAAGNPVDSVAVEYGGMRDVGPVSAGAPFIPTLGNAPRVLERAFAMKAGEVSDSVHTAQGVVWVRLKERAARQGASFASERSALAEEMLARRYAEWVARKRKDLKIEILRPDLRVAATPPPPITIAR